MRPLHVLVVARWYPSHDDPGRGSFVADHVAALRGAGVDVTVASFDPTGVRAAEATRPERGAAAAEALAADLGTDDALSRPRSWGAEAPVARLPAILDGSRRGAVDVAEAHARALLPFGVGLHARQAIDIIHAHTGLPDGVAATRLAERLGVPLLTTEHSSTAPDELADADAARLYGSLLSHGRRVVAVSDGLARELAARLGFEVHEIGVLPNAVPVDAFPAGPTEGRDPHEFLYVGTRKRTKGIDTLLRAFALVRLEDPQARLRLIGGPASVEDESAWRELADRLALGEAVAFEGRADRAAVAEAMRRAWVFVHPSPRETFGMVAVEAIASGLPVAATPSGGVEEIIGRDGQWGEIAGGLDAEALAAAIRRVLGRRAGCDPVAMHGHAASRYAAPAVAARTLSTYESLMHEVSPGSGHAVPQMPGAPTGRAGDGSAGAAGGAASPGGSEGPGEGTAPWLPPLVVGLARDLASRRLAALPPELLAGLTIATFSQPEPRQPQPGHWLEHDPESEYLGRLDALGGPLSSSSVGRLFAAVRAPARERARRDLIARRADVRREGVDAFLRSARQAAGGPRFVLALDADDVLVVEPLLADGARLAPGGLRWLVDRWDGAGRPTD